MSLISPAQEFMLNIFYLTLWVYCILDKHTWIMCHFYHRNISLRNETKNFKDLQQHKSSCNFSEFQIEHVHEEMANQCIITSNLFKIFATHNHISHVNPVNFKDLFNPQEPFGKTSFFHSSFLISVRLTFIRIFLSYSRSCSMVWRYMWENVILHEIESIYQCWYISRFIIEVIYTYQSSPSLPSCVYLLFMSMLKSFSSCSSSTSICRCVNRWGDKRKKSAPCRNMF